ncbi:MAG TPA: TlpA disulfide reductase family protein [Ignavibacteria bacterium]|nr:TlpA disulfide reductase family protein [Ignavibacteria bacterium]
MKKILVLLTFVTLFIFSGNTFAQGYDFDLTDLDGNSVKLSELVKKGPVFVQFWATWCVPCKEEMKVLNELYNKYKDSGFVFVAVSIDDQKSLSKVKPYIESKSYKFTVLYDTDKNVFSNMGGQDPPYSVFLDRNSNVFKTYSGYIQGDDSKLENDIKEALKIGKN